MVELEQAIRNLEYISNEIFQLATFLHLTKMYSAHLQRDNQFELKLIEAH